MAKYVVRYGVMRLLGVFSSSGGGEFRRGTPVIVRTDRGLEAAEVLCEALDVAIAVPVLFVLAPLLAFLALLVRLDSPGPVLFRQKRLGYRGRPFEILKFRTMKVLEDGAAITQARPGDARATRVGRWLRAYSLDELPQFINVAKGEMSLVGPRPHARAHDEFYECLISGYQRRQDVRPGITGWAQIHGLRGATPTIECMSRRVDLDVWYANHASFALDLKILLRTPMEVLRRRNAY